MSQTMTMAGQYKFRLKGNILDLSKKETNPHKVSLDARISANTAYALLSDRAREISRLDLDNLIAIFIDGLGYEPEEILEMPIGDLFTIKGKDDAK